MSDSVTRMYQDFGRSIRAQIDAGNITLADAVEMIADGSLRQLEQAGSRLRADDQEVVRESVRRALLIMSHVCLPPADEGRE